MRATDRYRSGEYLEANPDWHISDSAWKCDRIIDVLGDGHGIRTVCEVGCGAGEILRILHNRRPDIERLVGYEIAEVALALARERETDRLTFVLGNAAEDDTTFDLMLIMDVIEHVPDPIAFLADLRAKARRTLIHIPLDLSAQSILRPQKLITLRATVGHLHYFTLETALATVTDAGYSVQGYAFTPSFELPHGGRKAQLVRGLRRHMPPPWAARILGGYSLLVDATP